MNDLTRDLNQTDEETLACNVSDEALEAAADPSGGLGGQALPVLTTNPFGFVC
jgi:hypothetical protein